MDKPRNRTGALRKCGRHKNENDDSEPEELWTLAEKGKPFTLQRFRREDRGPIAFHESTSKKMNLRK